MNNRRFERVHRKLTPEERERHRLIREQVEKDKPQLFRETLARKAQMEAAFKAMQMLKREREQRGVSLSELAERSGINKSNLSRLENDINANPTLETLVRIARAIGGELEIGFRGAA